MYVFGSWRVGGVGGEWVRGLDLGSTNPGATGGKWDMCLCFCCGDVVWVVLGGEWVVGLGQGMGGWGGVISIVLDGCLHILGAPSVQYCYTLSISASYRVFISGRYRKSRFCLCVVGIVYLCLP